MSTSHHARTGQDRSVSELVRGEGRRRASLLTGVAVVACAVMSPALIATTAVAAGPPPPVADPCGRTSWMAGTAELCDGVLVYRDYVMDDYGAGNLLDPTSETVLLGTFSQTAGDARYPDGAKAGTADLIDLSVRLSGDRLIAVFELNALYDGSETIAALAVDTDDNSGTGTATWDGIDGVQPTGAEITSTSSAGDEGTNTITLELPAPQSGTLRLQALTAQSDGTVMNVAFRGTDEQTRNLAQQGSWFEGRQAAALAAGDISEFAHTVDVADLRNRVTRQAPQDEAGLRERVFTSAHTIGTGEGYSYEPVFGRGGPGAFCPQQFASFGRYQPYAMYTPEGITGAEAAPGLQLLMHGCNANHTSQIDGAGFQRQFGDDLGRVIVSPLGRGPIGFYSDISERDVFEAVADADELVGFDPDRWHISGYSMGGYGALRLGALYPHLWADVNNWVGFTGDAANNPTGELPTKVPLGAVGNVIDLLRGLEHIPSQNLYAGADELVQLSSSSTLALALTEAGVDHRFYLHPTAEHLSFIAFDEWSKEAAQSRHRTLVRDPAHVVYRTDASLAYPEYGIKHDRAYWVSGIRPIGDGYSDVDLTTSACGGSVPVRQAGNGAGPSPVPWVSTERNTVGATPVQQDVLLQGTLVNVAALTVDAVVTCLAGKDVTYALSTDGPATLTLSDGRTAQLPAAGEHRGVITARPAVPSTPGDSSASPRAASPSPRALAATGPATLLPSLVGVLLMSGLLLRRRP